MRAAMIGDNCIDFYREYIDSDNKIHRNIQYVTGNVVDTGVNLQLFGYSISLLSTVGNDSNGKLVKEFLSSRNIDISHLKTANGLTAITYMTLNKNDRVHGDYIEGVLKHIEFDETDIAFAASHDLVHSALWGNAEEAISQIKNYGNPIISFDYADELNSPVINRTIDYVDYGFFSYHKARDEFIESYLVDKVNRGMKVAVATFGSKGSLAYDGYSFTYCPITPIKKVVNTVGAGDSYISGFLASILEHKSIRESMEIGSKIAAEIVQVFNPWI